jgi:hypothetical protein
MLRDFSRLSVMLLFCPSLAVMLLFPPKPGCDAAFSPQAWL